MEAVAEAEAAAGVSAITSLTDTLGSPLLASTAIQIRLEQIFGTQDWQRCDALETPRLD
jgi:hypothetical protein